MRRRLLILAPAFPPHPSPATHRARFLARYGRQFGWDVEVLSVRPECYEEPLDWELARLVPPDLVVHRAGAWPARLTRRFGVGNLALRSYGPLRSMLLRLVRERAPDLLYVPGPPFYNVLMAAEVRRHFGVPYVPDFTDPWVFPLAPDEDRWTRKAYWAHRLSSLLEPTAVRHAANIVTVSEGTTDILHGRYPDLPRDRFTSLPFGFEPTDFDALRTGARRPAYWPADDGRVHVVYVGVVPPDFRETVRALLAAVRALRVSHPRHAARLRLHFFGTSYDPAARSGPVLPLATELGVGDAVEEHVQRIPYVDALSVLTRADGVLALGSTQPHYTASKIFPCLLARRPLLAFFHRDSTAGDIVRRSGVGELVTYDDHERAEARVAEVAAALLRLIVAPRELPPLDESVVSEFSAERMSSRLFALFDRVVGGRATERFEPPVTAHA
jgi:glycosyltransferase involved in cell wall biosynthesis